MSDYVPTTEAIRQQWNNAVGSHLKDSRNDEFLRWLNSIKADAWDEGFDAGELDVFQHEQHDWANACIVNPYRIGGKNV